MRPYTLCFLSVVYLILLTMRNAPVCAAVVISVAMAMIACMCTMMPALVTAAVAMIAAAMTAMPAVSVICISFVNLYCGCRGIPGFRLCLCLCTE